jgi:polar amino acid transport system substrate-binding protein
MHLPLFKAGRAFLKLTVISCMCLFGITVNADSLEDILSAKKIIVGINDDQPGWGQRDSRTRKVFGLQAKLAANLASQLGVELELLGLDISDRESAVIERRIDVLISTLSVTDERLETMNLVMPYYYASRINIMTHRDSGITDWSELQNSRICALRGSSYNRIISLQFNVDIVSLYRYDTAMAALFDGRCVAVLNDEVILAYQQQQPSLVKNYHLPLKGLYFKPWAVALNKREQGGRLEAAVSAAMIEWHRTGLLLELEAKAGMPTSSFSTHMHEVWKQKRNNAYLCGDTVSATTPKTCLQGF